MFSRIMVPLDGSEPAERAFPYAQGLVAATGGSLHLVRVVELHSAVATHGVGAPVQAYEGGITDLHEEARTYLERLSGSLEPAKGAECVVLDGRAPVALLDYVRANRIDLVIMTARGRSGLTRGALGRVADRIAQEGATAVLLVPADRSG